MNTFPARASGSGQFVEYGRNFKSKTVLEVTTLSDLGMSAPAIGPQNLMIAKISLLLSSLVCCSLYSSAIVQLVCCPKV